MSDPGGRGDVAFDEGKEVLPSIQDPALAVPSVYCDVASVYATGVWLVRLRPGCRELRRLVAEELAPRHFPWEVRRAVPPAIRGGW